MSEDWKNKDIQPYLKGKPANWSDTDNDWVAFKGNEKLEQELASIKKTQSEILERLDKPIDTQVTGSNVEELLILSNGEIKEGSYYGNVVSLKHPYYSIALIIKGRENKKFSFFTSFRTENVSSLESFSELVSAEDFRFITEKEESKSKGLGFRLYNNGDEPFVVEELIVNQFRN